MYTAELKLPGSLEEKEAKVESVIKELSLTSCRDTVIGSNLERGVSGGEAKRVNIALALIAEPRVIFLDEPTTGLDSHTANEVIASLKALARDGGHTVIATIHSPTSYAFGLFDDLILLKRQDQVKGGQVIFAGSLESTLVKSYFSGMGFQHDESYSVVEWLVELTSGKAGAHFKGEPNQFDFVTAYQSSSLYATNSTSLQEKAAAKHTEENASIALLPEPSFLPGLCVLLKYRTWAHYHSPEASSLPSSSLLSNQPKLAARSSLDHAWATRSSLPSSSCPCIGALATRQTHSLSSLWRPSSFLLSQFVDMAQQHLCLPSLSVLFPTLN